MNRYEAQDRFIWRFEGPDDKVGQLLAFVFDPAHAPVLADMLTTSVQLAQMVIEDCQPSASPHHVSDEQIHRLSQGVDPDVAQRLLPRNKGELYSWDGEPGE